MKPQLSEASVAKIMEQLLERFGEPIGSAQGDRQGVPSKGGKKEDMGNRGFGAKLEASMPGSCNQCGGMMGMDEAEMCTQCGMMDPHVEPHHDQSTPHVEPDGSIDMGGRHEEPHAPDMGMAVVTVKAGPGANKGGGGRFAQGLVVKDMDGIPATGSGRGTQASKAAPPAPGPKPMPTELDEESEEDKQERMHKDLDGDHEEGESAEHREKVLGHDDDMDEGDLAGADLDEESAPPPSGGSGGGSSPPPSGGGGGSSPPPSGMDQGEEMDEDMDLADLNEKTPPGREKQVRALKKQKDVDNPWAVAWASYNKSHGK